MGRQDGHHRGLDLQRGCGQGDYRDKRLRLPGDLFRFLVTYSVLATTQSVTGQTQVPLDVVFVVDFSGSIISTAMDDGESRLPICWTR